MFFTLKKNLFHLEQLRRLDEAIRFKLAEKQKVICDMYRVPNEHFSEIADIAGQPEAPKVFSIKSQIADKI